MFYKRHSKTFSSIIGNNNGNKTPVSPKKKFKLSISTTLLENYINYLADTIKKRTTELTSFNPLKKIDPNLLIDLNEQTYEAIYYILSKLNRTYEELLIIKVYLSTIQKFLSVLNVKQGVEQLLFSLAVFLKCEKKQQNSIVFRYGDQGSKCYILLIGNLSILLPKENKVNLTFLVYIKHLILLSLISENEILTKTISTNKLIYPIDEEEIENIINYIKRCVNKKIPYSQIKILDFDLSEVTEIIEYYNKIIENIVNKNKKHYCSVEEYIKITYLYENEKKERFEKENLVTIYSYFEIVKKGKGDIFGEVALQNEDKKRTATIICIDDCVFGSLSKNAYNNCLKEIEVRKRRANVTFILSFPIFTELRWNVFESKYFNFFKLENFNHGDIIIQQGSIVDKVFFVKEGLFQLNSFISSNELTNILKEKRKIIFKPKDKYFKNEKKKFKITIINNKDILGLEDICFENKYFVDAICISTKASVFSITKNILLDICKKIPEIQKKLENIIKFRETIITDRLLEIYKNNEKNFEQEIKRKKINVEKNLTEKNSIFEDALKEPELGKRNKLKSAKTKLILRKGIENILLSPKKKNYFTNKKLNIHNNNIYNLNNNNNYTFREKLSFSDKINNRVISSFSKNKKSRNVNIFNSPTISSYRTYIKSSNEISSNKKSDVISFQTFLYPKRNNTKYLKKIIGNDYEEYKQSFKQKKFTNFLIKNKKIILQRQEKENEKSSFDNIYSPVDLLFYENNVIEDKKKEKEKIQNSFNQRKRIHTASSSLLNYSNFNKNNIIKNGNSIDNYTRNYNCSIDKKYHNTIN